MPLLRYISGRSRTRFAQCAALALFAALAVPLQARTAADAAVAPAYREAVESAEALAAAVVDEANLPGLSIAVGIDGAIVWSEGFGYADVELGVPVTPLTRFRIGSVSKPFTATAVGLLYEAGKLDLDVPVQRYVPDFPEKRWPVTTRQLGGHIAGIRHYRDDEFLSSRHYGGVLEGLQIFADDPLLFEPGTDYSYSSYGWNLISAVVQSASGEEFLPFMMQRVFRPLGMRHTVPDQVTAIIPQRSSYYEQEPEGRLVNAPFVDNSYKWAGGGFLSTTEDLIRFGFGYIRDPLLKPETVELLFTPQRLDSGEGTGYGIGWSTREDWDGRRTVGHTGGSVGGTTAFWTYPKQQMVIAAVSNLSDAPGLTRLVFALGELFTPPAEPAVVDEQIAGRYSFETMPTADEKAKTGTMEIMRTPDGYSGWIRGDLPYARIAWVGPAADGLRIFAAGRKGVVALWLHTDGKRW
ncbi:MAG TPA: serine hydrolase domain-containing protein, partial [Woeseiaceae bacterium]